MKNWTDGRVKQRIISALLRDRAEAPELYAEGDYQALDAEGPQAPRLLGYIRRNGSDALAVVVPRLWNGIDGNAIDPAIWEDISLALPQGSWLNVITGENISIQSDRTKVADLLKEIPFVVLRLTSADATSR